MTMTFDPTRASHLPLLTVAVMATKGEVIECGGGWGSTPVLESVCRVMKRRHTVYEDAMAWAVEVGKMVTQPVVLIRPADWCRVGIPRCGVCLVDHAAFASRGRALLVERLHGIADVVVVHDTEPEHESVYGWEGCWAAWKYHVVDDRWMPWTTAVTDNKTAWEIMNRAVKGTL
jgi:hypothetical protein